MINDFVYLAAEDLSCIEDRQTWKKNLRAQFYALIKLTLPNFFLYLKEVLKQFYYLQNELSYLEKKIIIIIKRIQTKRIIELKTTILR